MINQLKRPPVFIFLILLFIVLFGPLLAPYDPLEPKPMNTLAAPSWNHWFGTDNYGFDVLSRVLYAAQIDFSLSLVGVLIGGGIGSLLGATAAYKGGFTDFLLLRFVEVIQSFPVLLFALALFAAIGGGNRNMILVIAIVNVPMYLRIIRSSLLPLRTAEFIDNILTRVTLPGSFFLAFIAIFPYILMNAMDVGYDLASFFGGTSLLIIVGVALDTLQQIESHLMMRHYDGFLSKGKIRGRRRS